MKGVTSASAGGKARPGCLWIMQEARPEGDANQSSGLDAEENMGISSPLYQIIDVVFDLRARGFLRRQVCVPSVLMPLPHIFIMTCKLPCPHHPPQANPPPPPPPTTIDCPEAPPSICSPPLPAPAPLPPLHLHLVHPSPLICNVAPEYEQCIHKPSVLLADALTWQTKKK